MRWRAQGHLSNSETSVCNLQLFFLVQECRCFLLTQDPWDKFMDEQTLTVRPGPNGETVRTAAGEVLRPPPDWALLPPGDAALTRRVKAAGPSWTVQEKKGRKIFSHGV